MARLVGALFVKINQPQVVGEIVAGLVLGPSVLGAVWPTATTFLFPNHLLPYLDILSQVGLVFFTFLIGLELDVSLIRGRGPVAATVSHVSIIAPFLLGSWLTVLLFPTLGSASGLREAVAAGSAAPLLIVRRHGQRGWLRRQREWVVATHGAQESRLAARLPGS